MSSGNRLEELIPDNFRNESHKFNMTHPLHCAKYAPNSAEMLTNIGAGHIVFIISMICLTVITLMIYVEEIVFIMKHFTIGERRKKTIWILAFFPVFSVCSVIAVMVPKSGPLVHMVANVFFCTCLYQILQLAVNYMGGLNRIFTVIEPDRHIQLNTPPLCCCCLCCAKPPFNRVNFLKVTLLVMQIAIVRPIVLFISAVLWTDSLHEPEHEQIYSPGQFHPSRSFVWLATLNVISTVTAVYGLIITSKVLEPELEKEFQLRGKIISIQGTLIMTVIPNIIIGVLVSTGVITCSEILPAKVRGEEIYFGILVVIMIPFSLLGRSKFRRASDGNNYALNNLIDSSGKPINGESGKEATEMRVLLVDEKAAAANDGEEKKKSPENNNAA